MKTIWLVNPYAAPPEFETRLKTIKTAEYLVKNGFQVVIFGGSFIHNTNINLIEGKAVYAKKTYSNLNFVHIKTNCYGKSFLKRFLNLFTFHQRFKKISRKFPKPDLIIHDANLPFGAKTFRVAKKLNAEYFIQVQDLYPESYVCYNLIKRNGLIHQILKRNELNAYRRCDKIIFTMEGGRDYIIDQGWALKVDLNKIIYLNNGVDINDFDFNAKHTDFRDDDLEDTSFFKVIYLGSIRLANQVELLIDAAKFISNAKIKILIYGDGIQRDELLNKCDREKINQVVFKQKRIDLKDVPYVLSHGNLNILNYQPNQIWRYGGSQSKLFQYLAAGKPILSNINMNYSIINRYQCGIDKAFHSSEEYAKAIEDFVSLSEDDYDRLCENARQTAYLYDYEKLTQQLIDEIKKCD